MTDALTLDGTTQPTGEWALDYGIYPNVITDRLARGWSIDRAITTPMVVAPRQRLLQAYARYACRQSAKKGEARINSDT